MKRILNSLAVLLVSVSGMLILQFGILPANTSAAIDCSAKPTFFGLPTWYEFLGNRTADANPKTGEVTGCSFNIDGLKDTNKFWLIGLAIVDILLHVAGLVAGGMIIFGGFKYITGQGDPQMAKNAKNTIINAVIGLLIAMIAVVVVRFIAGAFK